MALKPIVTIPDAAGVHLRELARRLKLAAIYGNWSTVDRIARALDEAASASGFAELPPVRLAPCQIARAPRVEEAR